jgi:hypothetical protein
VFSTCVFIASANPHLHGAACPSRAVQAGLAAGSWSSSKSVPCGRRRPRPLRSLKWSRPRCLFPNTFTPAGALSAVRRIRLVPPPEFYFPRGGATRRTFKSHLLEVRDCQAFQKDAVWSWSLFSTRARSVISSVVNVSNHLRLNPTIVSHLRRMSLQ